MKATYLLRNRSRQASARKVFLLVGILLIGVIVFSILRGPIIRAVSPLWLAENVVSGSLGKIVMHFQSQKVLMEKNINLENQVISLEAHVALLERYENERVSLLELLRGKGSGTALAAGVLTHPPQSPYDVIVIDVGSNQAVHVGERVFLPEGALIGRVVEVLASESKVKLFSASGEETNAVLERGSFPVVLSGSGGGNFMVKVTRDTEVVKGDAILSPNVDSRLLAIVEEVNLKSTDSFKEVLARSPANIFTIRFVYVTP